MADEQIIYLSPEEELTTVRERLERAQAQRIILIIPPQTQLRSHVGWRLLHARARELDKDVLVISSDRQIRSVVKAAGFRVAESQESPPSGGTRPPSRPSRTGPGGRTGSRLRAAPGRSTPDDRGSSTDIRLRQREQPAPRDFIVGDQRPLPAEPESHPRGTISGAITHPPSSTFGVQDEPFGPDDDFRINTSPPSPAAEAEHEFDEHDPLVEDYKVAQSIRQAAQWDEAETLTQPPETPAPAEQERLSQPDSPTPALPTRSPSDPFTLMEDQQPVHLPEQRGAAPIDELDEGVPDISEYPTEEIADGEIEDLGDEGDIVQPRRLSEPALEEEETEEAEPSGSYGMQPRSSRQDILPEEVEGEDTLPPIQDQPPRTIPPPPSPVRPSTLPIPAVPAGSRSPVPQPLMQQRSRTPAAGPPPRASARGTPTASAPQRAVRPLAPGTGRPATAARPARRTAARRGSRNVIAILATVIILFLIAVLAYGYFVPSADVTITIPAQEWSIPLALTATASSQQDAAHQTVRAQTLVFDKTLMATGHATGSKQVGTTPATGKVIFTNKSNQSVHIPTGTIVSTSKGVQFATTADVLVLTVGSNVGNTIIVPVQAQSLGTSGNVATNSITVIPPASLSKIAQANGNAPLNLSVTNPDPITNGGLGNAATVTQNDVQALKITLDQQLQQQAKAWLASQVHPGNVPGTPVQMEAPPFATPVAGGIATNGTFSESVSLHLTVLLVRTADLQAVAQAVFNAAVGRSKANYALAPGQMLSLTQTPSKSCTPSIKPTALTLCYTARGLIAPQIPVDQIRDSLASRTVKDATDYLSTVVGGIAGGTTPSVIRVHPDFFPWLPFWSQHITIHLNVVRVPTAPKK